MDPFTQPPHTEHNPSSSTPEVIHGSQKEGLTVRAARVLHKITSWRTGLLVGSGIFIVLVASGFLFGFGHIQGLMAIITNQPKEELSLEEAPSAQGSPQTPAIVNENNGSTSETPATTQSQPTETGTTSQPDIIPDSNAPSDVTVPPVSNPPIYNTQQTLLKVDFSNTKLGPYTEDRLMADWNNSAGAIGSRDRALRLQGAEIRNDNTGNRFLRKQYPAGSYSSGDMTFFWNLAQPLTEVYFSYKVRMNTNFDYVKGGKIPGLCGGNCVAGGRPVTNAAPDPKGNNNPNGKALGWSARSMWRAGGNVVQYTYTANKTTKWGVDYRYLENNSTPFSLADGKWHTIEHYVKMNTVGKSDGVFKAWFDGKEAVNVSTLRYRDDTSFAVDQIFFTTFFGGNTKDFASSKIEYSYFDDIILSTSPITHR
jgi:hypothetical protein